MSIEVAAKRAEGGVIFINRSASMPIKTARPLKPLRPRVILRHEATSDWSPALCGIIIVLLVMLSTVYAAQHVQPLQSTEHFVAEGL